MPELPEIETICKELQRDILNKEIISIDIRTKKLKYNIKPEFESSITGAKISSVNRRAKYIMMNLDNQKTVIIHLGMSGVITIGSNYSAKKHDHLLINLSDRTYILYNDVRRFGFIDICNSKEIMTHKSLRNLGPEPFSDEFNVEYLFNIFRKRTMPIKNALMDGHIVVGIGNIYASESLFRARILPQTPCKLLSQEKLESIIKHVRIVLEEAIEAGGSTLRNYSRSSGEQGNFQHKFYVYDQYNKNCKICKSLIMKIKQSGRSSFFCPRCQY